MKVITDHPVATDSPDHIFPWGTARDNTSDLGFILEIEYFFGGKKIKTLDVGCSGGQLTIDFNSRGHTAIGIEGSDYSLKTARANWIPEYYNKFLFTCDATKPYSVTDGENNDLMRFDLITSWEVLEHIHKDDFDTFFGNMVKHMHKDSIFCASISPKPDIVEGHILHQSVYSEDVWKNFILTKYFDIYDYPFQNKVRLGGFWVMCTLKQSDIYGKYKGNYAD